MQEMSTTKSWKFRLAITAAAVLAASLLLVAGVLLVRQAQRDARRSNALGRLSQMKFALQLYENQHGTLPPLVVRDSQGRPMHSWRALILPHLESESLKQFDLSQPWDSDYNRKIIEETPLIDWGYFARDLLPEELPVSTHLFALLGAESIWDQTTGLPEGTMKEHPDAILLISVPISTVHPMQPGDITESEVRELVESGHEVLFIMADAPRGYGRVTIERGRLQFRIQ